jgi:hypothetical protein
MPVTSVPLTETVVAAVNHDAVPLTIVVYDFTCEFKEIGAGGEREAGK